MNMSDEQYNSTAILVGQVADRTRQDAYQECIDIARDLEMKAILNPESPKEFEKGIAYGAYHIIQRISKLSKGEEPVS